MVTIMSVKKYLLFFSALLMPLTVLSETVNDSDEIVYLLNKPSPYNSYEFNTRNNHTVSISRDGNSFAIEKEFSYISNCESRRKSYYNLLSEKIKFSGIKDNAFIFPNSSSSHYLLGCRILCLDEKTVSFCLANTTGKQKVDIGLIDFGISVTTVLFYEDF